MTLRKKLLVLVSLPCTVILFIAYYIGCPWNSQKAWKVDAGGLKFTLTQEPQDSRLWFSFYSVSLDVLDNETEYSYYVDHDSNYWWSADVQEVSPDRYLLRKNGSDFLYYNHAEKETIHLGDYSNREVASINGKRIDRNYFTDITTTPTAIKQEFVRHLR